MKRRTFLGICRKSAIAYALLSVFSSNQSRAQISTDAIVLTLRAQSGIHLDTLMALEIDSGLVAARNNVDTVRSIHAFPDYVSTHLLVKTNATWAEAWHQGNIHTGERYIDSLGEEYGLNNVQGDPLNWFLLSFSAPKQMRRLALLYKNHPDVIYAEPNWYMGDGDRIQYFKKDNVQHFVFSRGWGDCPAGCISRFNWYVSVIRSDTGRIGQLEDQVLLNNPVPYFYRWNIPSTYSMTMFSSAVSIIDTINSAQDWWIRRHAIEGAWRFYFRNSPWSSQDNNSQWYLLRDEIRASRSEVVQALNQALHDADLDVRASAQHALDTLMTLTVKESGASPITFSLAQNYPNPFNPSTTIRIGLPKRSTITVRVFNTLGQEICTLFSGEREPGYHDFVWDGRNSAGNAVSSGIYFYSLEAEGLEKDAGVFKDSKKMLLVK